MADWTMLPKELLQLISEKLNSQFYLIRFRSVCSSWRFSIPKPHNLFPFNLPQFSDSNDSDIHKLFKDSIFLIKPPTTSNQQTLYRPWLVRISPTSTGKFKSCHPILPHSLIIPSYPRVLDFSQLSVFNIGHMYIQGITQYPYLSTIAYHQYDKSVAAFQGGRPLDILTRRNDSRELMMFRCGDDHWTKINNVAESRRDICIFKGRPCVTDETGRTVMIGSDLSVHLVAEPVFDGDGDINIIVENESELLLIHKYEDDDYDGYDDDYDGDEPVRIDVFRLNQTEKKWVKLANLGDRVLFLGQGYSFTACASDLGFDNGNFVIYCNHYDNVFGDTALSVYHLDQRQTFPLSDYPDYIKWFRPPPEWIISRCHQ
ncbi:F-box protein SKIP23-like [Vicia villosa]|uniref:F-box protein SKIP23-like n=1 Tax=Vicia villosa TaxID=3911 RepID=UPI00273BBF29|nr:F-box protein SKIP23-like [Vicia villosa]